MERDDVIEYSLDNHHSEEEGKKIRKNIYMVTIILSVVTVVEVLMGVLLPKASLGMNSTSWEMVKLGYVILTLLKAGYIVVIFMHLGDERKSLKWTILAPYALFILYLLYILFVEASA